MTKAIQCLNRKLQLQSLWQLKNKTRQIDVMATWKTLRNLKKMRIENLIITINKICHFCHVYGHGGSSSQFKVF